jgi:hypothetical protein
MKVESKPIVRPEPQDALRQISEFKNRHPLPAIAHAPLMRALGKATAFSGSLQDAPALRHINSICFG